VAGDWIKMRSNLWDDPRVSNLCDLLDCGEAQIVGALYWLWATADQHTEDGILPGLSMRQIDRKTGVAGFAQALCDIGWLQDTPDGLRVSRFEEHNGASAKKRAVTAKRVANHRSSHDVTQPALQNDDASVTGALAREREEEEKSSVPNGTGGKPPKLTDPKEIIFGYGLSLLVNAGTPEKQARSFLGGLEKHHGADALIDKLRECAKAKPLQPLEWLAAALPPTSQGGRGKPNAQEALEAQNRAVAARFLESSHEVQ
jgi:hypothetical protein